MLQHSKMYSFCYLFIWLSEIVAMFFVKVILMLKPCWWFVVFLFEAINSYDLWSISYCQVHDGGLCNLFQEHPFQAFGQSHLWLWQTLSSGSCCLGWDSWAMIFVWVVVLKFFCFHHYLGNWSILTNWYFSNGLKPTTSLCFEYENALWLSTCFFSSPKTTEGCWKLWVGSRYKSNHQGD